MLTIAWMDRMFPGFLKCSKWSARKRSHRTHDESRPFTNHKTIAEGKPAEGGRLLDDAESGRNLRRLSK